MKKLSISFLSILVITSMSACNKTTKIEREVVTPTDSTVTETTVNNNSVKTEVRTNNATVTTEVH